MKKSNVYSLAKLVSKFETANYFQEKFLYFTFFNTFKCYFCRFRA